MSDSAPIPLPAELFDEILRRTQTGLIGFARGLLGNSEDARDAVQDVYVEAWRLAQRGGAPFRPASDPAAIDRWLFAVAYHRAISLVRRKRIIAWESLQVGLTPDPSGHSGSLHFEERVAESAALSAALASLEPEDVACLLLNLVQGFSAVEIARILEITHDAARKRTSRALQRLRAAYSQQNQPEPGPPSQVQATTQPSVTRKRGER